MIFFCYSSFSALKYSLIRRDPNASTLEIHRLVQAVLKQGMDETTQRVWAERVIRAINLTFSDVGVMGGQSRSGFSLRHTLVLSLSNNGVLNFRKQHDCSTKLVFLCFIAPVLTTPSRSTRAP